MNDYEEAIVLLIAARPLTADELLARGIPSDDVLSSAASRLQSAGLVRVFALRGEMHWEITDAGRRWMARQTAPL